MTRTRGVGGHFPGTGSVALVLSCEHGSRRVPRRYAHLFASPHAERLLKSHRGCDDGALGVARVLARRLAAPLHAATVTRLLVDLNRSPRHRALFSELSAAATAAERADILARYYEPHRTAVRRAAENAAGLVVHIGVHSFTPRLGGEVRRNDAGLLYDPARPLERQFCARWQQLIREYDAGLAVRRNYPYRGRADGLTTTLRRAFAADRYLGLELELSQARLAAGGRSRRRLLDAVGTALEHALAELRDAHLRP